MIFIYQVKIIENIEQIKSCPLFYINHAQWSTQYSPETFGQMALLHEFGLIITMTTIESNPLRQYTCDDSPVYMDSALEAFLNFAPEQPQKGYINFEMNANGALLSAFGTGRNRQKLKEISSYHADCTAKIEKDSWGVVLKIPIELICDVYGRKQLQDGDIFTCNFFKISEDPTIEHYLSYSPINSPTPNFHIPEYFAKAIIKNDSH